MQTLAFGGKGVMFFTYWQPDDIGHVGHRDHQREGAKTRQYDEVKRINKDVQTIGKYLLKAKSGIGVPIRPAGRCHQHGRRESGELHRAEHHRRHFSKGRTATCCFANRDYKNDVTKDVSIETGGAKLEHLDKASGQWVAEDGHGAGFEDRRGRCELYRWELPPEKKAAAATSAPAAKAPGTKRLRPARREETGDRLEES